MKKFALSFVLLSLSFGAHVMAGEGKNVSRQVKVAAPFNRLIIQGDVEIVLVNDPSSFITIHGDVTDVDDVVIKNHNGRLIVSSKQQSHGKKMVIRIPFQQLKAIGMYGDVDLRSEDTLKTDALKVFMDGACKVSLTVEGTVSITHSDECEIEYNNKKLPA
ncbi:hypothetical protein HB364_06280 [Pseudoflavitalea sp. X16]|uniref:GIN domain-containing protein n=1 Tax=Paraflavitalea devenefica TaxID=2716334 RepID=UPI00141E22E9|nr:DUF2807 domain-containing protein [Paraflavitalea devenefica]NII24675.1 hypothetical protein [Paraflavitalea devenefica]